MSTFLMENEVLRFTKLARSNSILGLSNFIIRALGDWPENPVFQKIAVIPPDEVLNYFEYYISLLARIDTVKDFSSIEKSLVEVDPAFPKFELELWSRIAFVLEERKDTDKLYESGGRFIDYLKGLENNIEVRIEVAEILRQYCVGLHNSGAEDKYTRFVNMIAEIKHILPKNSAFGKLLCENYRVIIAGKYDLNKPFEDEWKQIQYILKDYEYSEEIISMAMKAADDWMLSLVHKNDLDALIDLKNYLERLNKLHPSVFIVEVAALTLSNIYTINEVHYHNRATKEYEKLKEYLQIYPDSKKIQTAYITITKEEYLNTSVYRKVPDEIMIQAKNWSKQYPDKIEFPEAYFGLLLANLEYAQAHNMRNEQRRLFKEMVEISEKTDYSEYHEENSMKQAIQMLKMIYGY